MAFWAVVSPLAVVDLSPWNVPGTHANASHQVSDGSVFQSDLETHPVESSRVSSPGHMSGWWLISRGILAKNCKNLDSGRHAEMSLNSMWRLYDLYELYI